MKKGLNKGFTLIELLVVIAIIGILAGVVLTSLGTARNKAKNSRIISELQQLRTIAEMINNDNMGKYQGWTNQTNFCSPATGSTCAVGSNCYLSTGNTNYGAKMLQIQDDLKVIQTPAVRCRADASKYCITAPLVGGGYACATSISSKIGTTSQLAWAFTGADPVDACILGCNQ